MRIRTTGILGLFCALALGLPAVVSCATSGSGRGIGGAGGSTGNFGSTGCTKSPQQNCNQCNNACAQCMCFSTDTSKCSQLCNSSGLGGSGGSTGPGGSTSSGGTGGGTPGCSSGNCNQCTGCYDSCLCHGGSSQNCLSACKSGSGGSGGSGFGGSGFGGSGGSGFGGSGGSGFGGSGGSGFGGSGGSGGGTTMLGAQCTSNSQCGSGLTCATPTSNTFGGGGPSRGYCTRSCTSNSDCQSANAQCVDFGSGSAYCLLGCNAAGSNQCLGRYDEMCLDLVSGDAGTGTQACIPECATDADCAGLKCDLSTGLCTSTPKTGSPVGTNCDPTASTDPCAGFCIGTSSTDSTKGMCSALCSASSVGVTGACGSNPTQGTAQAAACLFQATMQSGTTVGICDQLCNCDSDCLTSGFVCESWANAGVSNPTQYASAFNKKGLCVQNGADAGVTGTPTCP